MVDRTPVSDPTNILLVTRRFWPATDDSAGRLDCLAVGLRRNGLRPTIVTPRYASSWPQTFTYHEIAVHRPFVGPRSEWSMGLYQRALTKWFLGNLQRFSAVYVDSMREEAAIAVNMAKELSIPSVCRCGGSSEDHDGRWANTSRAAKKAFQISSKCASIIVSDPAIGRDLVAWGVPQRHLVRCDDGVLPPIRRDRNFREKARAALGEANPDLRTLSSDRVILIYCSLDNVDTLQRTLVTLSPVFDMHPFTKVWVVGDGASRHNFHAWLCDQGLRSTVAIPGCFGHDEELYQAADVFLTCHPSQASQHRMPMAIGAGIPIVVLDSPVSQNFFAGSTVVPHYFSLEAPDSLLRQLLSIFSDWEEACRYAARIRQSMLEVKSRQSSIDIHTQLLQSLIELNRGPQNRA